MGVRDPGRGPHDLAIVRLSETAPSKAPWVRKIQGLDDPTPRGAPTASTLCLLGLVEHATTWERRWFQVVLCGRESREDWPTVEGQHEVTFMVGDHDTVDDWVEKYREQIEQSRAAGIHGSR
jgi:hypothetical protein